MELIKGKEVADSLKADIAAEVEELVRSGGRAPHLVAILVGNDGASQTYVGHKEKMSTEVGFRSTILRFDESISEEFLLGEIDRLNADPEVDGFIVQLPLPKHISEQRISEAARLGFKRIIVSGYLKAKPVKGIEVVCVNSVAELPRAMWGGE